MSRTSHLSESPEFKSVFEFDEPTKIPELSPEKAREFKDSLIHVEDISPKEWTDNDLITIPTYFIPTLCLDDIQKCVVVWIYAMATGDFPYIPELTVLLALYLRDPTSHDESSKFGLRVSGLKTVDENSPHFQQVLQAATAKYNEASPSSLAKFFYDAVIKTYGSTAPATEVQKAIEHVQSLNKDSQNELGSFLAFCSTRIMVSLKETASKNLNQIYFSRFCHFYQSPPSGFTFPLPHDKSLTALKEALTPGKTLTATLMVPILFRYAANQSKKWVMTETFQSILMYGNLMASDFNGLYPIQSYLKLAKKYKHLGVNLVDGFWCDSHKDEYYNLVHALLTYTVKGVTGRSCWRWSRLLKNEYLINYSGPKNLWLSVLFTALLEPDDDSSAWNKICLQQVDVEMKQLALSIAHAFRKNVQISGIKETDGKYVQIGLDNYKELPKISKPSIKDELMKYANL